MACIRHKRGINPPGISPWYPSSTWLRMKSGDRIGGTTLVQADTVTTLYYGVNLDIEQGIAWANFRLRIQQGQAAILQGYYNAFKRTSYDAAPGFYGNHAVYVNEVRWNRTLLRWEYLMYDPMADGRRGLPKGPMWIRETLLQDFAAQLVLNQYGRRVGMGRAWAAFTRDTEAIILQYNAVKYGPKTFICKFDNAAVRLNPNTNGRVVYRLNKGNAFRAYQVLMTGPMLDGSRVWYGNAEGTKWCHSKNLTGG